MARRGRKPTGTNLLEHLQGSERAKTRLKGILETLSAERSIPDVCDELGIGESMFHRVRSEVLQAALDRLEPRPLGRPPQPPPAQDAQAADLEAEILRLQMQLKAAEVRRELAENLPRLGKSREINPAEPGKKTTVRTRKRHRQRLQQHTNHSKP